MNANLINLLLFTVLLLVPVHGADIIITKNDLDVSQLLWSDQVVFMLTRDSRLFRSTDEGMTWSLQSTSSIMPAGSNHTVDFMYQDNMDHTKLLFVDSQARIGWLTTNAGGNYQYIDFGRRLVNIQFHPRMTGMAFGYSSDSLYTTTDFGRTWSLTASGVSRASWGGVADASPPETIYLLDHYRNFKYTSNFGKSESTILTNCIDFAFTRNYLHVLTMDTSNGNIILLVNNDNFYRDQKDKFQQTQFPFGNEVENYAYNWLDDSTGAVWLGLNHGHNTWGNVYTSGSKGYRYSISFPHVYAMNGDIFDFTIFHGLEGIYFGNNVTNWEQDRDPQRKTFVTLDNGGEWRYLSAPSVDAYGRPIVCEGACSLHLNGISAWYSGGIGPVYSTPTAVGLVLATGNLGTALKPEVEINTYFSRDAGMTWYELRKGSHIYEFGNHGGIIVMADNVNPTTMFYYSLDEGLTLIAREFTNSKMKIENIVVEPNFAGRKFLIHGIDVSTRQGVIYGVDFTPLQERPCVAADYEKWVPWDGRRNGTCLLGRMVTYSRRIRSAQCFNNRSVDPILSSEDCACSWQDYECDFGFSPSNINGHLNCYLSGVLPDDPPTDCKPGNTYEVTQGYRRVPGNSCKGGLDKHPVVKYCPKSTDLDNGSKGWIAAIIIILVLGGLAAGSYFVYRNPTSRAKVIEIKDDIVALFGRIGGGGNGGGEYSRVGRMGNTSIVHGDGDEEFGIGENDPDMDIEEDAKELKDTDIADATSNNKSSDDDFDPRSP